MENVNIKKLTDSILKVCKNVPITYINECYLIFRGDTLLIKNSNTAMTWRYEFTFNSAKDFLEKLRNCGLMLSQVEYYQIIQEYGIENTK